MLPMVAVTGLFARPQRPKPRFMLSAGAQVETVAVVVSIGPFNNAISQLNARL
jgi:hypothetical protein